MRSAKWVFATVVILSCAALAHADSLPPDGIIGVKGGSGSEQIDSLSFAFTFVPCAGATGDVLADCNDVGTGANAPQEIFAGVNDTGMPWDTLTIDLSLPTWNAALDTLGCGDSNFFSSCTVVGGQPITSSSPQTVTVDFSQGTGTGIGCYDTEDFNAEGINGTLECAANSLINDNLGFGPPTGLYDNPFVSSCDSTDEVCGGSDFVIGIGYGDDPFLPGTLPSDGAAGVNGAPVPSPEPSSLPLLFAGLAAILSLRFLGFTRRVVIAA
jgi:hypothetical protein